MAEVVWQKPVKDTSGGYLSHTLHGNQTSAYNSVNYLYCGFKCKRNMYIMGFDDQYESTNYQSFLKFKVPTISGSMTECLLYLWFYGGSVVEANKLIDYPEVQVWAKDDYDTNEYPWQILDSDDYSTSWTQVGSLGGIRQFVKDSSQGWYYIDVTSVMQDAIDNGWEYFAIRLIPSYLAPSDWNWKLAPRLGQTWQWWWSENEECYAMFYGVATQEWGSTLPGTYESDTGRGWIYKCPILKLTYDIPTPPPPETTTVNVVAADPKAKVCLAGTSSGKLWRISKETDGWHSEKIFEITRRYVGVDYEITALYISPVYNFKDYPNSAVFWIGTSDGRLYKGRWGRPPQLISSIDCGADPFVEIRGNEFNPDEIVVGVGPSIHVTHNGGGTWTNVKFTGQFVTGLFVRGNEIQAVWGTAGAFRSPDFGETWYNMTGEPSSSVDVAFSRRDVTKSVILTSGCLQKYDSGDTSFHYVDGAAIDGTPTVIDADLDAELMVIGTTSKLYQTINWGQTVEVIRNANVKSVSLGGGYLYTS